MRTHLFLLALILSEAGLFAQSNDPLIMTIDDKQFKKSEFEYFYNKYNNDDVIDKRSLLEYVELFKNLKLKVAEAEAQGMDTTTIFLTELSGYRSSEAKSYLEELEVDEELVRKIYNRMKETVEVSQILIPFQGVLKNDFKTFPSDTLEAYNKAVQIRNRLLKGENFEKVATELQIGASSQQNDRPGYLGWVTALMLNPPFEEVVYNTPAGKIGQLVRTNYGFHIVKVHAKKENPGQINAAHILISCPPNADVVQVDDAQKKVNEIFKQLTNGADFAELAKEHSADSGSASRGGDLDWFGLGMMVKEFQDAAFNLKEIGDISKPVKSQYGYHIIKLKGKKPVDSFEEKRNEIENKLNAGGYFIPLHKPGIEKMKNEFGFKKNEVNYQQLFLKANTDYPSDSLFYDYFEKLDIPLFTIGDIKYSSSQFINYMKKAGRPFFTLSTELLNDRIQGFEYSALFEIRDKTLESKFPDFKNLIQEYRDGILMFEVSNKEVWRKASEDTEGLTEFFAKNKKNYEWDEPHFKGYVILVKDSKTKKKMQKEVAKKDPETAVQFLLDNYRVGEVSYVKVEKGLFKRGENAFADEGAFKMGVAERPEAFKDFFLIGKVLKGPESYLDIRGLVITDFQNFLEEMWLNNLNKKYKVTLFPDVLNTIK